MLLKSAKLVFHIRVWGTASKTNNVERHEWHLLCSLQVTAEAQSISNLRPYTCVAQGEAGRGTRDMCIEVVLGCFLSGTKCRVLWEKAGPSRQCGVF